LAGALTPTCLLACERVLEMCTGWLRAPKGEGLPPRVCACTSQRLDLGDKLGDSASKHTAVPQPGECTTARYGRNNDSSDEYDELQVKPFLPSCTCMHASARKPLQVYWAWSGGARQNTPRDNGAAKLASGGILWWQVNR
jgi:hypothetical protein